MPYSSQFAIISKIKNIVRKTGRFFTTDSASGISEAIARKIQKSAFDVASNPDTSSKTPPYMVIAEQLQSKDAQIFRSAVFYLTAIAINEPKTTDAILELLGKSIDNANQSKEQLEYVKMKVAEIRRATTSKNITLPQ